MSTKKKRLGSRRQAAQQNETPKADKFHVMSSTSVPQGQIPEEDNETLSVPSNLDHSQSETQHPPSPDHTSNRRKLGSRRRNKEQHVKSPEVTEYHKPREEVEENTRGDKAVETKHTILATQSEKQEESSQRIEHAMSETHDSSSCSASTPGYYCEVQNPTTANCAEDVLKHADQEKSETNRGVMSSKLVETMLEETEKCDTQSEEVKVNAHIVGSSDLTGLIVLSHPAVDHQLIDQSTPQEIQEELFSVYSAMENENKEREENIDLLRQEEILQGKYCLGESHVKSVVKPTEDVVVHSGDNERTEVSLTTESTVQDKFDPSPTEEVTVHSSPTVDQQIIVQSNVREMLDEELPSVSSVTDTESKEKDKDADLSGKWGILQPNNLVSELQVKSDDKEPPMTPEISTEKSSLGQHTEPEFSAEQEIDSSAKEDLSTNEEQNEHFSLSEVGRAKHSEDVVERVDEEEEIKPTETQDIHLTDYSSESVIPDATENSGICLTNLMDQAEVSDTYQSELSVISIDDSAAKQEDLNPDDNQNERSVKESNVEALDQINEDYHVSDTKKPQTSDTETVDTALTQVYENEGRVEDDIKPTAQQTSHQEMEGLLSEVGENESSLQTLQSETNAPLDSQPQDYSVKTDEQTETDFNPIGNRRKLGSSRRYKGRQHVKSSVDESHHKPTEDFVGHSGDNEPIETTEMSSTTEKPVQEFSLETKLEGMDESDPSQTEEVTIHSNPTVDQQIIDVSNVREMLDEELPSVSSVTDTESKEKDEDTDLLEKWGILQANNLVSELQMKSDDKEPPMTPEVTTEKSSLGQHTEPEFSAEQEIDLSSKEDLSTNEEQNEHFSLSEVGGAQHPEDVVERVDEEEEIKPTEMQNIHLTDYSSESVIPDATENSGICLTNLMDQAEVSDTYQSELSVISIDDSAAKQEDLNPDDNQNECSVKESNVEALDQINEDYHVSDTKKPQTSDTETVDTALTQVYENEGRVEDDIKPTAQQTSHQEMEGLLSEVGENESSLQTLQSETNAPLDSQPQDYSVKTDEQTETDFNSIGNRRKLGSSRRYKGRQHVKSSVDESPHKPTEDFVGHSGDNEPIETTEMSSTTEKPVQEFSLETKLEGMDESDPSQTEEVTIHSSPTVDQQIIDQSNVREMLDEELPSVSSVTDTESKEKDEDTDLLGKWGILQANNLVSELQMKSDNKEPPMTPEVTTEKSSLGQHTEPEFSAEQEIDLSSKEDLSTNEEQNEHFSLSEVGGAQHSEDVVERVDEEEEIKPTEMQNIHFTDYSSESVIPDATENSETCLTNLMDQAEVSDTYQSELGVISIDDSAAKQEDLNPDDNQNECSVKESNVEALDQINEDYHVSDTKKPQTSDTETVDTALTQVYENEGRVEDDIKPTAQQTSHQEMEGLLSEVGENESSLQTLQSETNAPLDSQPQDYSVKTDEQTNTDFNSIGNRRKLGSSRRYKGRRHVKSSVDESPHKPTEDFVEHSGDNEPIETTEMSSTTEKPVQEFSLETKLEGKDESDPSPTEEVTVHSSLTVDQQIIDQSNVREMLDEELPSVSSVTDTESKEKDEDTDLLGKWGILQANNLVNDSSSKSEGIEFSITPQITTEKNSHRVHAELEFSGECATVSSSKEELSTNEEQNVNFSFSKVRETQHPENAVHEVHEEEEDKSTEIQEIHQIDYPSIKDSPLDSQIMDSSQGMNEETHSGFTPKESRRKLGSSRRHKVRQHVPDSVTQPYPELKEEVVEHATLSQNIMDSSTVVTTDIAPTSDKDAFLKSSEEVEEEERKHVEEPENFTSLREYDAANTDAIQSLEASFWKDDSDTRDMSYHDDNVKTRSVTSNVFDQEEALRDQNTEVSSTDIDSPGQEVHVQQTNYVKETVGDVIIKDYGTEAETSVDVQGPGQVESREECEDPAYKSHAPQERNTSKEVTHAELLSAAQNKTDTWAPFDIGHGENLRAAPAADVSNSQQDIQEKPPVDNSENSHGKFKQKRRKMGSTRRSQLNRKQEGETDNTDETKDSDLDKEADVRNLDRMEAVEELPLIVTTEVSQKANAQAPLDTVYRTQRETNETSSVHKEGQKLQSSTSDLQTIISNMPDLEDSMALLPEQSASHNEEDINPVRHSAGNVDVSVEPPQLADVTSTETQTASEVAGRNRRSVNQWLPEGAMNPETGITVSLSQSSEAIQVIQDQVLKSTETPSVAVADLETVKSVVSEGAGEEHENTHASIQEPNNMNDEAHNTNFEMKSGSPNFSSTNRRRKMGSTRRNLGLRSKGEDFHQKREVDNEETATHVGDALTEVASGVGEKELQHNEHKDGDAEQRRDKVFETVEYRHIGEYELKPQDQQTDEENPVSLNQPAEAEHQLIPDHITTKLSTSPKHDDLSETAAGGRRRKMGSHRKSRGHQNREDQTRDDRIIDAQKGRDVEHLTDESAIETTEGHKKESMGLDKISEVDESDKKPSSILSISQAAEHTRPVSEKATNQAPPTLYPHTEVRLDQERQKKFSFADSRGAEFKSPRYNVLMIGDTSVGKTSFMRRAQSGKFSLEVPASIGLDSCLWTVVVDGKPVVLNLWDTAGQERFRSITKQVFHRAQAFLLMYDITSSQSFSAVSYWANCIQEGAPENVTVLLLGNKCDDAKRQVETQVAENLAKECDFEFMECSAATGENVIQALETVARVLSQKLDIREEAMVLHKEPPQKKRSGCC